MSDDFDILIDEALDNIRNDRKLAREFLNELANQIANNATTTEPFLLLLRNILKQCSVLTNNW